MTRDVVTTVIGAAAGGSLVVLFAVFGEMLQPKRLAGLFSAAPSIAIAGLAVTVVAVGDGPASRAALGMIFGAAGFAAFSTCVHPLLARMSAVLASLVGVCAWVVVAAGTYMLAFR